MEKLAKFEGMKITDKPEVGRLLASKDHDYPFYFDGEKFTNMDGTVRLDSIRSDGDYFIKPVFVKVNTENQITSQTSPK